MEDSVINNLRNNNDIVIAYAVENFAWVRKINYTFLHKKMDEWKGYHYNVNLMKQNPSQSIVSININKTACDSLMAYIAQTKAWAIKGDNGRIFVQTEVRTVILMMLHQGVYGSSQKKLYSILLIMHLNFMKNVALIKTGALFLSIKNKIETCVDNEQGTNM